jgi:uncharacterized protein (DUF1015 family)
MSKIIPFKALLPKREIASQVISPPYDVISSSEAREWISDNPFSFLHITKSEVDLPESVDQYGDEVYEKAADNLKVFEEKGYLTRHDGSFYVYRQVMGEHGQTGIVCGVSVDEYENGKIRKHERTREEKVVDRTRHAYTVQTHTEPVMLVHRAALPIFHLINETEACGEPLYDIVDRDGVRHLLWQVKNTVAIQKVFEGVDALYIADGHHRSESAFRVRDFMAKENKDHAGNEAYNYFPAVIYPDNEVRVFEYDWKGDASQRPLSKYSMNDIMKLADEGGIMPPKSTWFAPKLGSGLFVYMF